MSHSGIHTKGRLLDQHAIQQVEDAIAAAERLCSAQIKVIVTRYCWTGLEAKAARLFAEHGLDRTPDRNGVLILLVEANHDLLIHGDSGIDQHVDHAYWCDLRDQMIARFKEGRFAEGIADAIARIGQTMAAHFPPRADQVNLVTNEVVTDA